MSGLPQHRRFRSPDRHFACWAIESSARVREALQDSSAVRRPATAELGFSEGHAALAIGRLQCRRAVFERLPASSRFMSMARGRCKEMRTRLPGVADAACCRPAAVCAGCQRRWRPTPLWSRRHGSTLTMSMSAPGWLGLRNEAQFHGDASCRRSRLGWLTESWVSREAAPIAVRTKCGALVVSVQRQEANSDFPPCEAARRLAPFVGQSWKCELRYAPTTANATFDEMLVLRLRGLSASHPACPCRHVQDDPAPGPAPRQPRGPRPVGAGWRTADLRRRLGALRDAPSAAVQASLILKRSPRHREMTLPVDNRALTKHGGNLKTPALSGSDPGRRRRPRHRVIEHTISA